MSNGFLEDGSPIDQRDLKDLRPHLAKVSRRAYLIQERAKTTDQTKLEEIDREISLLDVELKKANIFIRGIR